MKRRISELEVVGGHQNFASVVGSSANGRGHVADGVTSRKFLAESSRRGFVGPKCRATSEHGLTGGTDEFEKTCVCVEAISSIRTLNYHRHRAAVERLRKTFLRTT